MQQCLPFTVLKLKIIMQSLLKSREVATVLTVYGIETYDLEAIDDIRILLQQCLPFTVLKQWRLCLIRVI